MIRKLIFTLIMLGGVVTAQAQQVSSDDLLKQALRETNVTKNYKQAISLARKGLAQSPDYTDIRVLLARLYFQTAQYNLGIAETNRVLAKQPRNKDVMNYAVNGSVRFKNYSQALKYASRYLAYYPSDKTMALKRVGIYRAMNNSREAVRQSELLRKKYPRDPAVRQVYRDELLTYANAERMARRYENAYTNYQKVLTMEPANKDALNALFNLSVQLKRYTAALGYADKIGGTEILVKKADLLKTMGRYQEAGTLAARLLAQNPGSSSLKYLYKDIYFTRGQVNLQISDTAQAISSYRNILEVDDADTTARNQLINIHSARKEYEVATAYIQGGLKYYPDKAPVLTKKIDILQNTNELQDAYKLSDSLVKNDLADEKVRKIHNELFPLTRKNRIGMSASLTAFEDEGPDPWQLYSLFYLRTSKFGSYGARVNYADRANRRGYQFELEAYPKHGNSYSYINLAYSQSIVFPEFRASYSYFAPVGTNWDVEVGARYLKTYFNYVSLGAAAGRYFDKVWLNLKTYQTPNDGRVVGSYTLTGRYYMKETTDDFVTAIAGYGFSPEDLFRNFQVRERINLESLRFTAGYQRTVLRRGVIGVFGTWNNQEFVPGRKRNEFDFSVSFQHKF